MPLPWWRGYRLRRRVGIAESACCEQGQRFHLDCERRRVHGARCRDECDLAVGRSQRPAKPDPNPLADGAGWADRLDQDVIARGESERRSRRRLGLVGLAERGRVEASHAVYQGGPALSQAEDWDERSRRLRQQKAQEEAVRQDAEAAVWEKLCTLARWAIQQYQAAAIRPVPVVISWTTAHEGWFSTKHQHHGEVIGHGYPLLRIPGLTSYPSEYTSEPVTDPDELLLALNDRTIVYGTVVDDEPLKVCLKRRPGWGLMGLPEEPRTLADGELKTLRECPDASTADPEEYYDRILTYVTELTGR